ncbi:hypothetical protein [Guptibacillus spartinae]|uniref:hypothetical protein n=1 Tax=Guptibacillus spartinae TaxID=3025679 RepID=UPI00235E30AC|nr:hypothetical protein [Pseudalkalibacillus spartinae]
MKVLFVEPYEYYSSLGVEKYFQGHELFFNGVKKYNKEFDQEYDLVVSYLFHSEAANHLVLRAKKEGVNTMFLVDGVFDWANSFENPKHKKLNLKQFHPIPHDYILCIGECEKKYFEQQGVIAEKYLPKRILNNQKPISLPIEERVLITTANNPYFSNLEKDKLIDLLKEVITQLKKKETKFIFRIFDKVLLDELSISEDDNFISESFEETLSKVNAVITTPSSIILTAMFHDRSVGTLIYRDVPLFLQSGWLIHQGCDVSTSLDNLISMDKDRMYFQEFHLKNYLEETPFDLEKMVTKHSRNYDLEEFVNNNMYNMLNSKFNINFEFKVRSAFSRLKKLKKKIFNK